MTRDQASAELARCERERTQAEEYILAGGTDIHGAALAIADWSAEERLIRAEADRG